MKRLLLRPMFTAGAALVALALLSGCGTTPQPTEPPATQTPWVVIVTSTSGPAATAEAQPTSTTAPTRQATAEPTETTAPTQVPTRTSAPAGTTPGVATATTGAEETASPTATTAAAAPSNTPRPTSTQAPFGIKYAPPVLLEPSNNQSISWQGTITFKWVSVGELAEDEYYVLEFYRPSRTAAMEPYGDFKYIKGTEFVWEGSFKDPFHPPESQGDALVEWWVRVAHKTGEDNTGKPIGIDISTPSERRTLILRPKPEA